MKNNNEKSQNYVNILGIKVLSTSVSRLLAGVREDITHSSALGSRNNKFYIVTPNPEIVLASTKNNLLKESLNSANFSVPDGVGLSYASKFLFGRDIKIIPGRILFERLIELANKKGWKVFFLGGKSQEAVKAAEKLKLNYKNIKIETFAGPKLNADGLPTSETDKDLQKEAIQLINKFEPQLLFVAFGYPKQEIWIYKNIKYLNIGGAMTVGGTLRYVANLSKLPPKWMANIGLEWVWRLITEPFRFVRIFKAFPLFPLRIFWFKITNR
jgi:N-acetylglucosaminyldiphosphoundecaprenol N-acetyl-beta-D-mannosaminyltransferase